MRSRSSPDGGAGGAGRRYPDASGPGPDALPGGVGDEVARVLPQLRIDELLDEVQARLGSLRSSRDRVRQLLEAVVAIGSGLDLESALGRIVQAATTLVDAQYGALGVLGSGGRLARFITVGLSPDEVAAIGPYPEGKGVLGELIRHPEPLRSEDLTKHPRSYGFPPGHPPMHSFLGVPVRVREEVFGNLYMTEKQGGAAFDADDEAVLTALAAAAGVAIDNARLYEEARRRQLWLEATSDLSRGLLSGQDADDVLAGFAQRMTAFAQADLALIALPTGDSLLVTAADGPGAERLRGLSVSADDSTFGTVFASGEALAVEDAAADPRLSGELPGTEDLGPALLIPLGAAGHVRGVLGLARRAGALAFEDAVRVPAADLAVQAAVVLELADRRRDSELLKLYADRDRIGRDLHDLAIQRLFATSMSLQGAYRITQKPEVARRIAQAVADLDDTIKVIRSTIFALQAHDDAHLAAASVRAQVIESCERVADQLGFTPSVRFTGPVDTLVPEHVAEHLIAVLREALSNAARHAEADTVDVAVAVDGTDVHLSVADNGIGIAPTGRRSGLRNLEERARQLGGSFAVQPRADGGTLLTWSAPTSPDEG